MDLSASLPHVRKRLLNRPLPRLVNPPTPVADVTRTLLSLVYSRISRVEDEEKWDSSSAEDEEYRRRSMQLQKEKYRRRSMQLDKEKVRYWRSVPMEALWKEASCTIRHGFSGTEFAIITRIQLRELKNCRNVYRHVRELLQLPKHISLALYFVDCHTLRELAATRGSL